jgi:hypothetical protein
MKVLALKLITGEDVLGELESESETEFVILNPVGIAIVRGQDGQPNVGFSPFPIHGQGEKDATIAFAKKHVVYSYTPGDDFVSNYEQIFGTGLIVPKQQSIITG